MSYRILTLDGGGIRGVITAVWLEALQKELKNKPLRERFDLISGTSTGSLLACAVAAGMDMATIIDLYKNKGREIFPDRAKRFITHIKNIFKDGLSQPKYDGKGLDAVLKETFADMKLGELTVNTMVTSFDVFNRNPVMFKNFRSPDKDFLIRDICRASCSAPTYFPAKVMKLGSAKVPLVDGGVTANNPSACALAEGLRLQEKGRKSTDLKNFILASFGTGASTDPISIEDAQEWGPLEWAIPIVGVLMEGSTDATEYIVRHIMPNANYFRFQVRLEQAYDDMDNPDPANINALISIAQDYLQSSEGSKQLKALAKALS